METFVIKRNGIKEQVHFDKIVERIKNISNIEPKIQNVDIILLAQKVIQSFSPNMKTSEIDNHLSDSAAYMVTQHTDYDKLAARIAISNWNKQTPKTFLEAIQMGMDNTHPITGKPCPIYSKETFDIAKKYSEIFDKKIDKNYSLNKFDYFGFQTLKAKYLIKNSKDEPIECPQIFWMRVAIGIHGDDLENILTTFHDLSEHRYIHATPTLYNAGTKVPQMSSCMLLMIKEDSIRGIYETLTNCALLSKEAAGIGLYVSNVRAKGSYINGTNGFSQGIIPMLRIFNDSSRYVDQGGMKRKGSNAIYVEPWHADIEDFLDLKKNNGKDEMRARDLFFGLWTPDLFFKRIQKQENWSLFCPADVPDLIDLHSEAFEKRYIEYETNFPHFIKKSIPAQVLWDKILESQSETSSPFLLDKDKCNRKSNQQNLGTIHSSNLCTEIVEYTSPDEIAVCNLASIPLPHFVDLKIQDMDYLKLGKIVEQLVINLNKIIDRNHYPLKECENSNLKHRPIAIGVQGLADVFHNLMIPYESPEARVLNQKIFETIYFHAVKKSMEISKETGKKYQSFEGSPASKGLLQFDLWDKKPFTDRYNWDELKQNIVKYGMINSLLVGLMPTATTSQILGNGESFQPHLSNFYARNTLAGQFIVVNSKLISELNNLGLWNEEMRQKIIANKGSIQDIDKIPQHIKNVFKTAFEMSMKNLIEMAADRGIYVCQSQSFNLFLKDATPAKLNNCHMYSRKLGLKTLSYYIHSTPSVNAQQTSLDPSLLKKIQKENKNEKEDKNENKKEEQDYCKPGCDVCGS